MTDSPLQARIRHTLDEADADLREADRLLSIAAAARWLQQHGVQVHENTVRHWIRVGRVPAHHVRPNIQIALATLEHIAACPYCSSR